MDIWSIGVDNIIIHVTLLLIVVSKNLRTAWPFSSGVPNGTNRSLFCRRHQLMALHFYLVYLGRLVKFLVIN